MADCLGCNKSNKYQESAYWCFECKSKGNGSKEQTSPQVINQPITSPWGDATKEILDKYRGMTNQICKACGVRLGLHCSSYDGAQRIWRCPTDPPRDNNGNYKYQDNSWYTPPEHPPGLSVIMAWKSFEQVRNYLFSVVGSIKAINSNGSVELHEDPISVKIPDWLVKGTEITVLNSTPVTVLERDNCVTWVKSQDDSWGVPTSIIVTYWSPIKKPNSIKGFEFL